MANRWIKCPYCGSENYYTDKVCVTCMRPLISQEEYDKLNNQEQEEPKPSPFDDVIEVQRKLAKEGSTAEVIVTTGDLTEDYEIIGPVYFQVSNKGIFGSALKNYKNEYAAKIEAMKYKGTISQDRPDWGFLYGEWSVGQNDFEAAFFIATEELKKRAKMLGADAVICMRQDIDMDTNAFAYFYLQMYGTAVKRK